MTPRSLSLGLFVFLRVTSQQAVTGRCAVASRDAALEALPCGPDEAVVSQASHALGVPKGIKLERVVLCGLCVKPIPKDRHADGMHSGCRDRWQRAYDARQARERAKRRQLGRERQRNANIRAGVVRRKAKRALATRKGLAYIEE